MATPNRGRLDLSDEETEDLWASPSRTTAKALGKSASKPADGSKASSSIPGESQYDAEQLRKEALTRELESVRNINEVIEGVVSSLERAKGNMDKVSRTVTSATTLLNTWTRILSQTEHNQRLILNPNWHGATQDLQDIESEAVMRAQAQERKAAEEERRREEAKRRAEEEERQKQAGTASRGVRGSTGRGRPAGRGAGTSVSSGYGQSSRGYVGVGGQGTGRGVPPTTSRGTSGIGRGIGGTRGRARGV